MIIIGKKYIFSEDEITQLHKRFDQIVWLSLSQMSEPSIKKTIDAHINEYGKQMIVINTRTTPSDSLLGFFTQLELQGNSFVTTEKLMEMALHKCFIPSDNSDISFLSGIKPYSKTQYIQKRLIDYLAVLTLSVISFPIILYTIFRIKKESPGPVLFSQTRIGIKGRPFTCYKFRSMHENAHHDPYTRENDSRIFDYGNFMRKSRIDELPQLINVLKGDMHLIGPRAEWDILVDEYASAIPFYHERHLVKPGITGNAQVHYSYGSNIEDTRQKLMYDFFYIKYWSLAREISVIAKTVLVVIRKKGH